MGGRMIDLDEELLSLLENDEMFAFFDFSLTLPEERTVSGLCKISRPKSADFQSYYISLLFMIDAAESRVCHVIDEHINQINWEDLRDSMPEIISILSMPYLSERSGIYFREIDIYLAVDKLTRPFIARFHPLLAGAMGLKAETPTYWDDMPQDGKHTG
ncbi:MAG: hypothetical protein AB9866_26855 [Syntrophobacteraceae bacterium]